MIEQQTRMPTVLISYPGPCEGDFNDVFLYLRPESNGVMVESLLLKVIEKNPYFKQNLKLVYLANMPGDFMVKNKIVEQHYSLKIYYAQKVKKAFTPHMKRTFEAYYGESFEKANILSPYQAMEKLEFTEPALFFLMVPKEDMLTINGQIIKKIFDFYVINYDVPYLLSLNNRNTDIAVMVLRSALEYGEFYKVINIMTDSLIEKGVLDTDKPPSSVFHYSKGPFEQVLDAVGYLYDYNFKHIPLDQFGFCSYLITKGYRMPEIRKIIENPIMKFSLPDGTIWESDIYSFTAYNSYADAVKKLKDLNSQVFLPFKKSMF